MLFNLINIKSFIRKIHSITALLATFFLLILSISGVLLAVATITESINSIFTYSGSERDLSIAQLAANSVAHYPNLEQIERTATGQVIVYYTTAERDAVADIIEPLTGKSIAPYDNSLSILDQVRYFHRSLMLDDVGRGIVGVVSALLLIILLTGIPLLANSLGGWKRLFKKIRGSPAYCLHGILSRFILLPLFILSLSGTYLSLVRFEYLPGDEGLEPDFPSEITLGAHLPVQSLVVLQSLNISQLRVLILPYADDPEGVFFLHSDTGRGYIDPVTGQWLEFQPQTTASQVYEFIYALHTGEGLWWIMIFLGLGAALTPVMLLSGIKIYWGRRQQKQRQTLKHNVPSEFADTVILVGSEGHSSRLFAQALHHALMKAGFKVHCNDMNHIAAQYPHARRIFILTSTYGDGHAPASADQFVQRLADIEQGTHYEFAVLGFGDRQYANFCGFAINVEKLLIKRGWKPILPIELIDRQSAQAFVRWGKQLSTKLNINFKLNYIANRPKTFQLTLATRHVYNADGKIPIMIMKFCAPKGKKLPKFSVGDLLAVFPPIQAVADPVCVDNQAMNMARLYSIGSCEKEGFIELGVTVHQKGICSNALFSLKTGATIEAFIKRNEHFHHRGSGKPLILIGAGTGIVPLMGFIRNNHARHPIYLYWGGRDPAVDYLYKDDLAQMLANGHLTSLRIAFSRIEPKAYVQDIICEDSDNLRTLLLHNGELMICGGREMADGVKVALESILLTMDMSLAEMKSTHRYQEDVY